MVRALNRNSGSQFKILALYLFYTTQLDKLIPYMLKKAPKIHYIIWKPIF